MSDIEEDEIDVHGYTVHRYEVVRIAIRGIKADSPIDAVKATDEINLHTVFDIKKPRTIDGLLIEYAEHAEGIPDGLMVDPEDSAGQIIYDNETHLGTDNQGDLYVLPPDSAGKDDDAMKLVRQIAEMQDSSEMAREAGRELPNLMDFIQSHDSIISMARALLEQHTAAKPARALRP